MINQTVSAICYRLDELYSEYPIYRERVSQNLNPPCFTVRLISPERVPELKDRYRLHCRYDITFFPREDGTEQEQIYEISTELFDSLEFIVTPDGDILRGTNMEAEVADGILHFMVNYNVGIAHEREDDHLMETLEITEAVNDKTEEETRRGRA